MDLVANDNSRKKYCELFNLSFNASSYKALLIDRKDAIKSPDKILKVVESLSPGEYPYSFKKIRKAIIEDIDFELQ